MKRSAPPLASYVAWRKRPPVFHVTTNARTTLCGRPLDESVYVWPKPQPPAYDVICGMCEAGKRRLSAKA